jgi:tripartite-type tricarboxylate transporter receptor subunit TctC
MCKIGAPTQETKLIALNRRSALTALAAATLPPWAQAQATTYPKGVIKFVVPYPPGGGNDVLARSIKTQWEKAWGQAVIVENRAGANGLIATEGVARAPNDGYTLLMGSVATHAISPALRRTKLRFDANKDFMPVAMVGSTPLVLTVHPSVAANNVKEFVALARKTPGQITYASVGNGSAGHLAGALFEQLAGVDLVHIPYKGISQASTELAGGQVNAAFSNVLNVLPLIKTGKLKALGITGTAPLDILPDARPIGEALPGYAVELWWGIFAPAGTPTDIVRKLHEESNKYLSNTAEKAKWAHDGITLTPMSIDEFTAVLARDGKKWADVIAARKIVEE